LPPGLTSEPASADPFRSRAVIPGFSTGIRFGLPHGPELIREAEGYLQDPGGIELESVASWGRLVLIA